MSTHVVVPVRDQVALTESLVAQLQAEDGWDRCWVFDNGSTDGTARYLTHVADLDPRFRRVFAAGWGIYRMWEHGLDLAQQHHATRVLFLNNDIVMHPGTVGRLNEALDGDPALWVVYPDYDAHTASEGPVRATEGTYRHGGMCGWCFMVRAEPLTWRPLIDPRLVWWCGDDDLAFEIQARGGRQGRVVGLPVRHLGEATARHHDLHAQKEADLAYLAAKWGR